MAFKPHAGGVLDQATLAIVLSQISSADEARIVQSIVPKPRYRTYTSAIPSRILEPAQLYVLDAQLRGAILELFHFAEIGVRDAFHRELSQSYGPHWFKGRNVVLDDRTRAKFRDAEERLGPNGTSPERVIAEVSFGAWTGLLEVGATSDGSYNALAGRADYEQSLWFRRLETLFGGIAHTRLTAAALMRRIQRLRNRVAHHESIVFGIHQHGEKDGAGWQRRQLPASAVADLRAVLGQFCTPGSAWLTQCTHVDAMLSDQLAVDALQHATSARPATSWF